MDKIHFFTDYTKSENAANRLGDHQFFVRANDTNRNPGSRSPERVLIGTPAVGVKLMLVSTDLPQCPTAVNASCPLRSSIQSIRAPTAFV